MYRPLACFRPWPCLLSSSTPPAALANPATRRPGMPAERTGLILSLFLLAANLTAGAAPAGAAARASAQAPGHQRSLPATAAPQARSATGRVGPAGSAAATTRPAATATNASFAATVAALPVAAKSLPAISTAPAPAAASPADLLLSYDLDGVHYSRTVPGNVWDLATLTDFAQTPGISNVKAEGYGSFSTGSGGGGYPPPVPEAPMLALWAGAGALWGLAAWRQRRSRATSGRLSARVAPPCAAG